MKRPAKDVISSDDSSDSDSDKDNKFGLPIKTSKSEGELVRKAESYQHYMKLVPISSIHSSSFIPFTTWQGLGNSLKGLHNQALHYLTNRQLARWDWQRDDDASVPLDDIIDPRKAEAVVWLIEEVHRVTTCHLTLAEIWKNNEFYHEFIDPIFP